jgi:hypothetical protein
MGTGADQGEYVIKQDDLIEGTELYGKTLHGSYLV